MSVLVASSEGPGKTRTTVLIRRRVSLVDSNVVRHVVLIVLRLSHFGVTGKTSDQIDSGKIPGGRR